MRKRPGRPHRLPLECYKGEKTVCFDACSFDRVRLFTSAEVVDPQVVYLKRAADQHGCVVPIYCFMPDHLHVMIRGLGAESNALAAMTSFKTLSGKWMARQKLVGWQGNFYDHIVRDGEDWRGHADYIARNPIRAGLAESFFDYPFLGTIGFDLQEVIIPYG